MTEPERSIRDLTESEMANLSADLKHLQDDWVPVIHYMTAKTGMSSTDYMIYRLVDSVHNMKRALEAVLELQRPLIPKQERMLDAWLEAQEKSQREGNEGEGWRPEQ